MTNEPDDDPWAVAALAISALMPIAAVVGTLLGYL